MKINNAALPAYPAHQTTAHQVALRMVSHIPKGSKGYEPAYIAASAAASVGLTKRELFAMAAMQGMCAHESKESGFYTEATLAQIAVARADALLAELAKEPQS